MELYELIVGIIFVLTTSFLFAGRWYWRKKYGTRRSTDN